MRVIPPRFAVEIDRGIAGIVRRRLRPFLLATEALEAGPRLQQRAVREMLVGEQARVSRLGDHRITERRGDITLPQAVAILTEGGRRPNRVVHPEPDKPAIEHAVIDLLHQQPLAPHRVEILQQQRTRSCSGESTDGRCPSTSS